MLQTFNQGADLFPAPVGQTPDKLGWGVTLFDVRCLEVINGVTLMLANGQAEATYELAVLNAVDVQRLARMFGAGRNAGLTVALVLLYNGAQADVNRKGVHAVGRQLHHAAAVGSFQRVPQQLLSSGN